MYRFPIGVMLESFREDTDSAIKSAAKIGAQGIQMYATQGEHAPENMNARARRDLLNKLKDNGLKFSALCGDLGRHFDRPETNADTIERSKRILDMALDLETNIVTTHIGVVPSDDMNPRYKIMQDTCRTLAEYADSLNAHFAVETGPEPAKTLKKFLDSLCSTGVAVNLDPANFVMVTGDDPVQAVYTLKEYIVHTHAKDGIKLVDGNPDYIYGVVHPVPTEFEGIEYFREVPLGEGSVPFEKYLNALDDIGYKGFLTIERECGDTPYDDIDKACKFLKALEG